MDCLIRAGAKHITGIYSTLDDTNEVFNDVNIKRELKKGKLKLAAFRFSKGSSYIEDLVLYKNYMSTWQYSGYIKKTTENGGAFNIVHRQSSNIIFPSHNDITKPSEVSGDAAFNKLFTKVNNKYKLKPIFVDTDSQTNIFSVNNMAESRLSEFSEKFSNIVRLVSDSKGICFIYSQFKRYGAHILSIILEANGFERFNCDSKGNILEDQNLSVNE